MKNDRRIRFDLAHASSSNTTLLREMIRQNCEIWRESSKKAHLCYLFSKLKDDQLVSRIRKGQIISRYPNIKDLSHKDLFVRQMKVSSELAPKGFDFVPPQFEYPKEENKLMEYMKNNKGCCMIAKPDTAAKGCGIFLFRST